MHWKNWYSNQSCDPHEVVLPESEEAVVDAVNRARREGWRVRAAGSGHSNVPLVSTDGQVVDLRNLSGLVSVDSERHRVTVGAGTRICDLGPMLWGEGLSLVNQGDIDGQQLGGAIATGTHGTGRELSSMSSAVVGARIVRADGEVVAVDESRADWLHAAQTSLGALGILTEVTLQVAPAYGLSSRLEPSSWEDLSARWEQLLGGHRHFLFYWFPSDAAAQAWFDYDPPLPADSLLLRTMDVVDRDVPAQLEPVRTGPAHTVFPDPSEPTFHEMEFMVPIERAQETLGELRSMVRSQHPDHPLPVEVRFIAADRAFMSPFSGRDSCAMSVSGVLGVDNSAFFADCARVFAQFGGRPHWGKWHPHTARDFAGLYPDLDRFRSVRADFDPDGMFTNDYLGSLLDEEPRGGRR